MASKDNAYQTPMSNQMNLGNVDQGDNNPYSYYYGNYNAPQQESNQHTPGQQYWNHPSNGYQYNQFNDYNQYQNVNQGPYGRRGGRNATPRLNNAGQGRGDGGPCGGLKQPPTAAEIEADFLKHGISRKYSLECKKYSDCQIILTRT